MTQALTDELTSINAIYTPSTLTQTPENPDICILTIQTAEVSLRLRFPPDYPERAPVILGSESAGDGVRKGVAAQVVAAAQEILSASFVPGTPCVFELVELLSERLREESLSAHEEEADDEAASNEPTGSTVLPLPTAPAWTLSDVITDRKSVFVARCAPASSPAEARQHVQYLVQTDKKAARATHNITAWRIRETLPGKPEVVFQDCDDDGEDAAGGRLLHLLQVMDVWGVVVVVSRWYGGVQLGPDRFRIINSVARDAIVKGGFDKHGR